MLIPTLGSASSLSELAWAEGDAYYSILHESLGNGDARHWLNFEDGFEAVDEGNWRYRVTADALRLHLDKSEEISEVFNLRGLEAEIYLKRRWPYPESFRELKRKPQLAPVMMELFMHGLDEYAYSGSAYRDSEERALRYGILAAVGESGHPASEWFLAEVAESYYESQGTRLAAFEALGRVETLGAYEKLTDLYREARDDVRVRSVLLRAIGRHQTQAAWRFIEPILRAGDPLLIDAAIAGARSIAATRGWQGETTQEAVVRMEVGGALLSLLPTGNEALVDKVVEAISSIASSGVQKRLEELLARKDLRLSERARFERTLARVELAMSRL